MIAHGLAHTLRRLGMVREAEEVAYAWREPLVNNVILFIDLLETDLTRQVPPYIEPERIARYAQVTLNTASGEGARALAWYAYNSCQFDAALEWFQRGVAWLPKEATVYGYALTLHASQGLTVTRTHGLANDALRKEPVGPALIEECNGDRRDHGENSPQRIRHPRNVRVLPPSRDFH